MKKHVHKSRKNQSKLMNIVIGGTLAVTVILIVALVISQALAPEPTDYIVTADGHIHTPDGAHVGTAEELYGSDYVITEDGHVHAADGTHIGTAEEALTAEEEHDHTEDEAN